MFQKTKGRSKRFAFVWILSKKDAEKATEGRNGTTMIAGTAESLVSDEQKRKKQKRLEKKLKAGAAGARGDGEDGEVQEAKETDDDRVATEQMVAVDWVISKERWKEKRRRLNTSKRLMAMWRCKMYQQVKMTTTKARKTKRIGCARGRL